jgi:membrane-associated HD superfamily phosphohydrolase
MPEVPVTWTQLIITVVFVLVVVVSPQLYNIYKAKLEAQEKKRILDAETKEKEREAKEKERTAQDTAEETTWKRVVSEYERALESVHRLEKELEQLRPLALQNAVLETKMNQCREDKEDWKAHSIRLEEQLIEKNIIPIPFRRSPREDTGQQLKTVSKRMKAIRNNMTESEYNASEGSPTLVFPAIKKEGEQ